MIHKLSQLTRGLKVDALKMLQQALSFSFPIFSLILSVLSVSTTNSNIYVQCSQLNFTSITPYESNVNSLFASLVNSASVYNFNKFEISPQGDVVYGLFQCQGDLSSTECKGCVASSVNQLKSTCSVSIGGEIQLEGCFVKYDNTPFFGAEDKMEVLKRCGPSIGYNSDVLNHIDGALAYLTAGNGQYFCGGNFGSIQGVAQCVQDLSLSDCQDCLSEACGRLRSECETSTWGDMYLGKCYIRYIDQGNDNHVNKCDSSSNKCSGGKWDDNIKTWIAIVIAALASGGTLTFSLTLSIKRCCNYYDNKKVINMTENVESAKSQAKSAHESAEAAKKKADVAEKKAKDVQEELQQVKMNYPYGIQFPKPKPNPCPYLPNSYPTPCRYMTIPDPNPCHYMPNPDPNPNPCSIL